MSNKTCRIMIGLVLLCVLFITSFQLVAQSSQSEYVLVLSSPDDTMIASVTSASTFEIINAQMGSLLFDLQGFQGLIFSIAWSPDSLRIAAGGTDSIIRVWCVDRSSTPQCTPGAIIAEMYGHEGPIRSIAWNSSNKLASAGQESLGLRTWNMVNYQPIAQLGLNSVKQVVWKPTEDRIAFVLEGEGVFTILGDFTLDTGSKNILDQQIGPDVSAQSVAWSLDGQRIAFGTYDGKIYVVNADTKIQERVLQGHTGSVDALAWNPDNTRLASAANDGTVRVWNAITGAPLQVLQTYKSTVPTLQISWSPDGNTLYYPTSSGIAGLPAPILFASSRDGSWELYTMQPDGSGVTRLTTHPATDTAPAWSPDRSQIAFTSSRDGNFEIYTMHADW